MIEFVLQSGGDMDDFVQTDFHFPVIFLEFVNLGQFQISERRRTREIFYKPLFCVLDRMGLEKNVNTQFQQ